MADEISRSLEATNEQVKKLNSELKLTSQELFKVKKSIKLDVGNVDLVKQKFALLNSQLTTNVNKLTTLKLKQQALDEQYKNGALTEQKYIKQTQTLTAQIGKVEKSVDELTKSIALQNKELAAAKMENFNKGLENLKTKATAARRVVLALTAGITAMVYSFIKTGDELSDTSAKLNASVESLQIGRNIYEKLAGGASEYDSALTALGTSMTSIAGGRGARYLSALKDLGLSYEELQKYDTATQLEMVTEALSKVANETERTQLAMRLMNENGRSVALIAAQDTAEINKYTQALIESGLISNEQAAVADELANTFDDIKKSLGLTAAEITIALLPAIKMIVDLVNNFVVPLLNTVAGFLESIGPAGQGVLLAILAIIAVLPTVIKLITLFNAANIKTTLIAVAIVTALYLIVKFLGLFSASAAQAAKSAENMMGSLIGLQENIDGMSTEVSANTTSIVETSTNKNINVSMDIYGHGDTALSESAAKEVAINYAEIVNKDLGVIITVN